QKVSKKRICLFIIEINSLLVTAHEFQISGFWFQVLSSLYPKLPFKYQPVFACSCILYSLCCIACSEQHAAFFVFAFGYCLQLAAVFCIRFQPLAFGF
ncbi:MAG TPA: hypothetical protein VM187_14810, partial [Niastella sp.]|nr:hypothetical protein [Niastella sp.]